MGARGPAPTPTKILEMRGSWRADGRQGEPRPPLEKPACPAWLVGEARAEWKRQLKELERLGLAAKLDRPTFAAYCLAWAEFIELTARVAAEGLTCTNADGETRPSQLVRLRDKAAAQVLRLADRFGFSPSARTRLRIEGEQAQGGISDFARDRKGTG